MILRTVAVSSLVAAVALRVYYLSAGWNADPTFLFGLVTPFVTLPLFAYTLLIAPLSLFGLLRRKVPGPPVRGKILAVSLVLLAAFIAAPTPLMPNSTDAFEWRMSSFSEAQFQDLARSVRSEMAKLSLDELRGDDDVMHNQILASLREHHAILRIETFPIELFVRDSYVALEWASGLTGGYEVTIIDGDAKHDWQPAPNIYADVAAYAK